MKAVIDASKAMDAVQIKAGELTFDFLSSGDLAKAVHQGTMLNQVVASSVDGSLNNLYMRKHDAEGISYEPLLGIRSSSRMSAAGGRLLWEGTAFGGISYRVLFTATKQGIWFWDVTVDSNGSEAKIDIIYGQDIGLADIGAVRTNEAYMSQYVDHKAFKDEKQGYVLCFRQNQPMQGGAFPYMQHGSLTGSAGYSTDGFQFFGLSYKETDVPEALGKPALANEVYQYEFGYAALQSQLTLLEGEARFVFYGLFKPNHPSEVDALEFGAEVQQAWEESERSREADLASATEPAAKVEVAAAIGSPLSATAMTEAEIIAYFPFRHQEEWQGGKLLSFFTDSHEHVVLKEKEMLVERPHGHILMSGGNDKMTENVMTTTSYMYGIFNSQLLAGNTNFHKLFTNARSALNTLKTSGQRIYVELDGKYRLLTMPSMFEIGFNYARWYYKMADDTIIITNYTTVDTPEVRLHLRSVNGKAYRFLVTNQVSMNNNEYELPFHMEQADGVLTFKADRQSMSTSVFPDLQYRMTVDGADMTAGDESLLISGVKPGAASLVVLQLGDSAEWTITMQGLLHGEDLPIVERKSELEIERYREFFRHVMNGFQLSKEGAEESSAELDKVNALAWWYTHNMLVHYSVPHGLEQYGGAAWGTRDVCQGPTEYFMAMRKYEQVAEILKTVYSHQYEDDGNWPQWFMFDRYFRIQQEESHGDIIVWPLKVLGDYLAATKDYSILQERVPYTVRHKGDFTTESATLLEHALKEIAYMKDHFLHDTHLSSYGDGDWDDTLQPANAQLKQYMISSWTVALTYQVIAQFGRVMEAVDAVQAAELTQLASAIKEDFNRYMLQQDVIPGFVYMEEPGDAKLMLHPTDTTTGIHYRLLPMTRSMISELLTEEQAAEHYRIIKEQLYCPDGVRLMDRPAQYAGGVSTNFKRAEQAANFGREVGLQYVHAHIRYVEAMAKLGKTDEVWQGLLMINPVGLSEVVPNAELRQSNSYFSSSDGKFNNRYEAQDRFGELRDGTVPVKGGWRIYSSGPGIYMNQLISNALGIRQLEGELVIDPILPSKLDGMLFDFMWNGLPITFVYRLSDAKQVTKVTINGKDTPLKHSANRYRTGGVQISEELLKASLNTESNRIEIFM
ncbi:GH36-type glycosyl hydrolase domain-containing protein [Paenibacillus sp. FJAT-27812]|uniref:GH36-type glycosyl hydrolase domain-containing protein n=1 Tax=Paenibacillus sp. FJAT-27812 TaxID=1684143 RepID=UPI0006A78955|nr:cellobiose phosphorylase [Paenibacillus sp. FJAT-27812]